jgi:hypothetical protein
MPHGFDALFILHGLFFIPQGLQGFFMPHGLCFMPQGFFGLQGFPAIFILQGLALDAIANAGCEVSSTYTVRAANSREFQARGFAAMGTTIQNCTICSAVTGAEMPA